MSRLRRLSVRLHGIPVAELIQDETGKMQMSYLPDADRPLSLGLPLRAEPYSDRTCEAYFGGLLPESPEARKAIARRYGANANNSFSLLRAIGLDCAGAVSLHDPEDPVIEAMSVPLEARSVSDAELAGHIRDLPIKPLFTGVEGLRLSLAGAQDKAAVCLIEGQPALPLHGTPTTHLLKPAIAQLEASVLNEYLCLRLASAVKLPVPNVDLRYAERIPYLLIERYDRQIQLDGTVRRIHQEDFCQALGISSKLKYQADGGPGLHDCFNLALDLSKPALARTQLMKRTIFNVLIGNCDAHAKNFSLLHPDRGRIELAPAYDLISTRYYSDLSDRLAMRIGKSDRIERLYAFQWNRFCTEVGIGFPALRKAFIELQRNLETAIRHERSLHTDPDAGKILDFIESHAAAVARRFDRATP
jgi:serine/threonine-protein kinase HipA